MLNVLAETASGEMLEGLEPIGAGLGYGLAAIGPGIGIGTVVGARFHQWHVSQVRRHG